jgi:hypothetical protein
LSFLNGVAVAEHGLEISYPQILWPTLWITGKMAFQQIDLKGFSSFDYPQGNRVVAVVVTNIYLRH